MIDIGQRVRHLKQAAWGVGVVTENNMAGGLVELVIDFETGERRLKLKPEAVAAMIHVLSDDESAEVDAQNAVSEAAALTEAKARSARMKGKKHEPRTRIEVNCLALADAGDGHAILAVANDGAQGLRVCLPDGSVAEEISLPDPGSYVVFSPGSRFVPTDLLVDGRGLIAGTRTHNWGDIMFARRGQPRGRMWRAPVDLGVTHVAIHPGVGALIHDLERLLVAREEGGSHEVPLSLSSRKIDKASVWGDGILLGAHGGTVDDDYFRYLYVGMDGAVRHEGSGGSPVALDDDLMITFDPRGVLARDRNGKVAGRLERPVRWADTNERAGVSFARVGEELVFALGGERSGLVRWHPRVDEPRWISVLSPGIESFTAPVRVGRFLAVTTSQHSDHETPKVWIVDAETGALVHAFDLKKPVSKLVPVGDDALVASWFSKQAIAWRGLSTAKPERLLLSHPSHCTDVISPAPGVVVTVDSDGVSFFDL